MLSFVGLGDFNIEHVLCWIGGYSIPLDLSEYVLFLN